MKEPDPFETTVTAYESAWRHITENRNLHEAHCFMGRDTVGFCARLSTFQVNAKEGGSSPLEKSPNFTNNNFSQHSILLFFICNIVLHVSTLYGHPQVYIFVQLP
jgi:hypothetical protein